MPTPLLEAIGPAAGSLTTAHDGFPKSLPPPTYPVGIVAGVRSNPLTANWLLLPNDGVVSVESARLDGMADFITLDLSHSRLRNNRHVAAQVIAFLQAGSFDHSER